MNLEIPIPVQFTIKMETDKAYIVNNVTIKDKTYLKEAVLPKMFTEFTSKEDEFGVTNANVEKWVLKQRHDEENKINIDEHINELIA